MAEKKEKRYVSDNAQLMTKWNWEKNNAVGLNPHKLTCGSGRKVWWKCENGHEWEAKITDCNRGHGCPFCSGRKAISGKSDLFTLYPSLIQEWCYERNQGLSPTELKPNTHAKVWWQCKKGHEWEATIKNRVNGSNCPYCAGKRAFPGENDLLTKHPRLAEEWHKERNTIPSPIGISCYSNQKVWWLGICGHEWLDTPSHRVMGRGCPVCNHQNRSSFPEQSIYYYISKQYPDAVSGYTEIFPDTMELDIYIPSLKLGIEYDGIAWHQSKAAFDREMRKFLTCKEKSIKLIRIKEARKETDAYACNHVIYCDNSLDSTIRKLSLYFPFEVDIDVDRDRLEILENYLSIKKGNSFARKHPNESKEWHPTQNGVLSPDMFLCGSGEKVWWKCSLGHEWQMPINERSKGNGCPYCSNHRVLEGFNDLSTLRPDLAVEWHPYKNAPLKPSGVLATSTRRLWWKCSQGHEWQASAHDRRQGSRCPYCSNKRVLSGYNDLATANPQITSEWNYEKNLAISPTEVTVGSSKKVWWICKTCGYEWKTSIGRRNSGHACPQCARKRRAQSYIKTKIAVHGTLSQTHPELISEWNYQKNKEVTPDTVYKGSKMNVWWICSKCGHEWENSIYSRTTEATKCPACIGRKKKELPSKIALKNNGSLSNRYPHLLDEWNSKRNPKAPNEYTAFSSEKVWWICAKEHEWEATIASRSAGGGCPYCNSRRILSGFNDLESRNPLLSEEWHPFKNGALLPSAVMPNSSKKVWWQCKTCGFEWDATITNRNRGSGCPACAKINASKRAFDRERRKKEENWKERNHR